MDKFFLKSKTIIGIIVSILPALLPQVGVSFSEADGQLINTTVDQVIQGIGAVLAFYGRFAAGGVTVKPGG
jgi:uncharacterized membrane protein (DUF441 family)